MISKAIFFKERNSLEIREIDIPEPKDNEVQARTMINGICMWDVWQYNYGNIHQPFIPGHEGIGVVTKVGSGVKGFKPNDIITTCEWSDYTNQKECDIIKLSVRPEKPEYHLLEPLACAVNAAANVKIYPGDRVIVFGVGYMGLLLLQLLARYPLSLLVAVDVKDSNLILAQQFGADEIINSTTEAGKKRLAELEEQPFEIAYECSGAAEALDMCTKLAGRGGQVGIYGWHHNARLIDSNSWHEKGLSILNLTPGITANERRFRSFAASEKLMASGKIKQEKLTTHVYNIDEISKAMLVSTARLEGFIKAVIRF